MECLIIPNNWILNGILSTTAFAAANIVRRKFILLIKTENNNKLGKKINEKMNGVSLVVLDS